MATYITTTFASLQPKAPHVGNTSVSGSINLGATSSSVGDLIYLAKVPNGAVIVDFKEDHSSGSTALALDFGLANGHPNGGAASFSALIAAGAQATVNRNAVNGSTGLQVSLSASDTVGFGILSAKVVSGTMTTSLIVNFVLSYRVDGN